MDAPNNTRSLGELITSLGNDITRLFRKEVELAKAEASEKVSKAMVGVEMLIAGAVLAIGALGVLLAAAVAGLGAFFENRGMEAMLANALSAVIIGVVIAVLALILIWRGTSRLNGDAWKLEHTTGSLQRDADVVKERF